MPYPKVGEGIFCKGAQISVGTDFLPYRCCIFSSVPVFRYGTTVRDKVLGYAGTGF